MTIHELFEKLDQECDRQGDYFFDPMPIAEQAIREAIERAGEGITTDVMGLGDVHRYRLNLLRELGIDNSQPSADDELDES